MLSPEFSDFSDEERESFFLADHELTMESESAYYERKADAIQAGEPTWWVANFDSDGRVYCFWFDHTELALVDAEDSSSGVYRVYVRNPQELRPSSEKYEDDSTMLVDTSSLITAIDAAERHWGIPN